MTKHDHREDDRELDGRLADDLAALHADLDRVLDLDAGLVDATLPGRVQAYTDDLDRVLDLDAGLGAILPTTRPSDTASRRDPDTAPANDRDTAPAPAEPRKAAELLRFARDLASMPAEHRLRTRRWLPRLALTRIRALVRMGHQARQNLGDMARALALDLDHDVDRAGALDRASDLNHFLDHDRGLGRGCAVDRALAFDLDRARALARDLARDLIRDLAGDGDLDLDRARALARDLARDLDLDLDGALGVARTLGFVGDRVLNTGTVGPVVTAFIRAVDADRSADDLSEVDLLEAVEIMERVVSDVVGADLGDVDLTGIPLAGVRWSSTTRWPPDWRDRVHRESTWIGPDLWEIGQRGVEAEHFVTTT